MVIVLITMVISKISFQIEIMDRQKIEINNTIFNHSNVQIGDKNKQEINTSLNHNKDLRIKLEKIGLLKLITDPSILAALVFSFLLKYGHILIQFHMTISSVYLLLPSY